MNGVPHFAPWEVLPDIDKNVGWGTLPSEQAVHIHQETLELAEEIRALIGPFSVNNYNNGGTRKFCGFRDDRCPQFSPTSQHSIGNAIDGHPARMSAEEARRLIRKAVASGGLPTLGGIELNVPWLHFDRRPRVGGKVIEFHA